MKNVIIAILFLVFFNQAKSQEKIPFIDYDEIKLKIGKSAEEGDHKKVLDLINLIHKNDSIYYPILTSKTYYLLQLKEYNKAIEVANEGINANHKHSKSFFFINKGVALTNLKKYDEALKCYEEGLKNYPKNYLLWHNTGVVLETKGNLKEAIEAYKTSILYNPLYKKPHLQLGNIFYKQNRLTQALMCFNLYVLLEPDASGTIDILRSLNNIVVAKNSNERDESLELPDEDDSYEDIDLILTSKIAMNKNYETGSEFNLALVRQNHAMFDQLKEFEGEDNFWNDKYLKLYNWITTNNYFDKFTYTLLYSIENEEYKKIVDKKEDDIIEFLGLLKSEWKKITGTNNQYKNFKKGEIVFEYENNYISAIGRKNSENTNEFYEFYNDAGRKTAAGSFNKENNRIGKWTWFNTFNEVSETAEYKDGVVEGKNYLYHDNGKEYIDASFKNGKLEGEYEYYTNKGALKQRKYFKEGNLDSIYKSYFKVGEDILEFYIPYKNDLIEGELLEYYADGNLYAKTNYKNGKINGKEIKYHYNKKIWSDVNYVNGDLNGAYKTYHSNGKPYEIGQSVDGFYDGNWKMYHSNGKLESEFTYDKGNLNDIYTYYDRDGKLWYEFKYRKGELIAFKYFDKEGKIIEEGKKKGGEFYYKGFSPSAVLTAEGLYDVSGGKTGEWKFYDNNGMINAKGDFKENKTNGDYFTYYKNGNIETISPYKDDVLEGYYVAYYKDKQMSTQGWYKAGNQHGEWRYYYKDGTLQSINFFHKGELHGIQEYYNTEGKLYNTMTFEFGNLLLEQNIDTKGNPIETIDYVVKEKKNIVTLHYTNQKPRTKVTYLNQVKHGLYTEYYFDGAKKVEGNYSNGEQHGLWTWFYNTGELESTSNYLNGKRQGKITHYYKNGGVEAIYNYENGNEEGTSLNYFKDGVLEISTSYEEGKLHGRKEFYDPSGILQLVRFYNYGMLIGYSYVDRNNQELPMIPIDKETGKITAFYSNGKPSKQMEFKSGELVNTYKSYFFNGNQEDELFYVDGEMDGARKEYFENGNLKEEIQLKNGDRNGVCKYYYDNGNKKEERIYLNDIQHGISKYYNESGKLIMKKTYVNGTVQNVEKI